MTDIACEEEEQVMDIGSRLFIDDMERALNPKGTVCIKEGIRVNDKLCFKEYFIHHITLRDVEAPVTMNFLGYELVDDLLWCYAECDRRPDDKRLHARSDWLTEEFCMHSDLLYLKSKGGMKTVILNRGNTEDSFY